MALPDIQQFTQQPGGIGGMFNALQKEALENQYSGIKNQYAPMTLQADAASKTAYSKLVGPQYIAKLMGHPDIVANSPDLQDPATTQRLYAAGMGQGTGNALTQMPGGGSPQPNANQNPLSLSRWLVDKFKGMVGGDQQQGGPQPMPQGSGNPFAMNFSGQGVNPQLNRVMAGIGNVESGGSKNPYALIGKDTGNGDRAIGKYQVMASNIPSWTKEAFGQSMTPEQFTASPEAQEKLAGFMMNKHLNAGNSPQDVGSIWFTGKPLAQAGNVHDVNGTTPTQYVNKMNQGMSQYDQPQTQPTYAENAGRYAGIKAEGEALGKDRAADIKDLNTGAFNSETSQATLDSISNILSSPEFEQIRQVPLAGHRELAYYSKEGTPAQQNMVGQYYTLTGNLIKDASRDFAGQFRKGEQQLLQGMKPGPDDTVDAARGKLETLSYLNKLLGQRSKLTPQYMSQYHINKGEAMDMADKQINGPQLRQQIHDKLNPTITIKNPQTGEVVTVPIEEARKGGFKHG